MSKNSDIKIRVKVDADTKELSFSRKEMDSLGKSVFKAGQYTDTFNKRLTNMAHATAAVWGVKQAFDGIVNISRKFTDIPATFETMEATLKTIQGSSSQAKTSMDWIETFTANTPYELEQVGNSFVKLTAYGIEPMDGTLRTLGDTASGMGKNIQDAVEALADGMQFEGERLREFGIRQQTAGDKLTYSYSLNNKQQQITIDKNAELAKSTLLAIWNEKFGGAMKERGQTFFSMESNMSDAITSLTKNISLQSGAFDLSKSVIKEIGDAARALNNPATLDGIGELAKTITTVGVSLAAVKLSFMAAGKTKKEYVRVSNILKDVMKTETVLINGTTYSIARQTAASRILNASYRALTPVMKAVPFYVITALAYKAIDSFMDTGKSLDYLTDKFDKAALAAKNFTIDQLRYEVVKVNEKLKEQIELRDKLKDEAFNKGGWFRSNTMATREEIAAIDVEMKKVIESKKALKDLEERINSLSTKKNKEIKKPNEDKNDTSSRQKLQEFIEQQKSELYSSTENLEIAYNKDIEKYKDSAEAKSLITAVYYNKIDDLREKDIKVIESDVAKSLGQYENYYNEVGNYTAAWGIKETKLRQEMSALSETELKDYLEKQEKAYKESFDKKDANGNFFDGWTDTVSKTAVDGIQDILDHNYSFDKMAGSLTSSLGSAFMQSGMNTLMDPSKSGGGWGVAAGVGLSVASKLFGKKEQEWRSSASDWEKYQQDAVSATATYFEMIGDTMGSLLSTQDSALRSVDTLSAKVGNSNVTLENYAKQYEQAINGGLTKDQISNWQALGKALEDAANAAKALREEELRAVGQHLSYEESLLELLDRLNEANLDLYHSLKDLASSADDAITALNLVGATDKESTDYYVKEYATLRAELDSYFTNGIANSGDSDAITNAFNEMVSLSSQISSSGSYGESFSTDLSNSLSRYQDMFDFSSETMDVRIIEDLTSNDTQHLTSSSYGVGSTLGTQATTDLINTASTNNSYLDISSAGELFSNLQAFEVAGTSLADDTAYLENLAGINYGRDSDVVTIGNKDILIQLRQLDNAGMLSIDASAALAEIVPSLEADYDAAYVAQRYNHSIDMIQLAFPGTSPNQQQISWWMDNINTPEYYSEINPYQMPTFFADGGLVTGATNAIIGEAGYPEAVIPLTSTDIMENLEGKTNKQMIGLFLDLINETKELRDVMIHANRINLESKNILDRFEQIGILTYTEPVL